MATVINCAPNPVSFAIWGEDLQDYKAVGLIKCHNSSNTIIGAAAKRILLIKPTSIVLIAGFYFSKISLIA